MRKARNGSTSRFAVEVITVLLELGIKSTHMIAQSIKKWAMVRIYTSKCDSVKEYVRLLNEHQHTKNLEKIIMLANNSPLDPIVLIKTLDKFSTTADYDKRVIRIIKKIRDLEGTYASDKNIK